jgi:hypothetical protein
MRRRNLGGALAVMVGLAIASTHAHAGVSADVNIRIGRPAPMVVFEREPDVVLVPSTRVYYVGGLDYDLFRYGQYWYINDSGYWYRARNYRGPFAQIDFNYVPRPIVVVPGRYHRHPMHPLGGPPGQMKRERVIYDGDGDVRVYRGGKERRRDGRDDRGGERGGGRGHGRGR